VRGILLLAIPLLLLPAGCDMMKSFGFSKPEQTTDVNVTIPKLLGQDWASKKPEEAAEGLFDVTSADERRDAIAYLCTKPYGHEPPYMRAYTFLATDPHPMVRAQAMRAIGGASSPDVVPTLIGKNTKDSGIKDPDAGVRADAALALWSSFSPEAIDPLVVALKDENREVRANAARALQNTSDPRALKALILALNDRDTVVINEAHRSLQYVTGQPIEMESRHWMEWYNNQPFMKAPATAPATAPSTRN
jgi:HEAT repeat protein